MAERKTNSADGTAKKRGGSIIPALCSTLGTLILVVVILGALPLTIPRLLGYEIYTVVSESMEPALPVGSIVYSKAENPADLVPGDIVVFFRSGREVTHRVTENHPEDQELITKGDANEQEDIMPVAYSDVIGRVRKSIPFDARLLMLYDSAEGKKALLCYAVAGLLLNILGSRLRNKAIEDEGKEKRRD